MKSLVTDMADFNVRWGAPPPDPSPEGFRPLDSPMYVHGFHGIPWSQSHSVESLESQGICCFRKVCISMPKCRQHGVGHGFH